MSNVASRDRAAIHDPEMFEEVMANWESAMQNGEPFDMQFHTRAISSPPCCSQPALK